MLVFLVDFIKVLKLVSMCVSVCVCVYINITLYFYRIIMENKIEINCGGFDFS